MDNTKIFIDIDDEIPFVIDRISTSKTQSIILVVPERAAILSSIATLKLLHHLIQKAEKKVVIVTMDEIGKTLSQKVGFKTRARVGEVESEIWDEITIESNTLAPTMAGVIPESPQSVAPEPDDVLEDVSVSTMMSAQESLLSEPQVAPPVLPKDDEGISVTELKEMNPKVNEIQKIVKKSAVRQPRVVQLEGFELMVGGDIAEKRKR